LDLQIVYVEKPEESAWGIIGHGVRVYNIEKAGEDSFQRLCYVVQAPSQQIVGGILCEIYWGYLHIDLLWVKEEHRRGGLGSRLLTKAEGEARARGARNAYLDTFSFQAPEFYERHGYKVFGELEAFPPGHKRFYLSKEL
jgi:ribosomal protein S18 acetylase RimI-like enzyme